MGEAVSVGFGSEALDGIVKDVLEHALNNTDLLGFGKASLIAEYVEELSVFRDQWRSATAEDRRRIQAFTLIRLSQRGDELGEDARQEIARRASQVLVCEHCSRLRIDLAEASDESARARKRQEYYARVMALVTQSRPLEAGPFSCEDLPN